MKVIGVILAVLGCAVCQQQTYVWDLLKPALTAEEVQTILANRDFANQYPTYNAVPLTSFDCTKKTQPGFFADVEAQCQVFHRCDINGNRTSYLCVNTTVFNQITLVCDYFFNVDCPRSQEFENFANSRLYTNQDLFDTPPADYVPPQSSQSGQIVAQPSRAKPSVVPAKPVRPAGPLLKPNIPVFRPVQPVLITLAPTTQMIRDQPSNGGEDQGTTTEMIPTSEQSAGSMETSSGAAPAQPGMEGQQGQSPAGTEGQQPQPGTEGQQAQPGAEGQQPQPGSEGQQGQPGAGQPQPGIEGQQPQPGAESQQPQPGAEGQPPQPAAETTTEMGAPAAAPEGQPAQ
ncbi:translation initiation factor IF-2-like [Paramacrobiotus metropolitanus]|uniref:translation initiation factor IF-2-like n=1 Tax=Paramacrobiotus metropolitanus TaxID=2943436 RepID=UPI0024462969|nr:translation initiation factor IF-2-like [Paramacrobiotus metropolitanus]